MANQQAHQAHQQQARYNYQAAKKVQQNIPDWAVTMCFYAALHLIDTYAKQKGDNFRQYCGRSLHKKREHYVKDLGDELRNRKLIKYFNNLKTNSEKARYLTGISINARNFYKNHNRKVDEAFQDLQKIQQILKIRS